MGMSHIDPAGRAQMVDVGAKPVTARSAASENHLRIRAARQVVEHPLNVLSCLACS